MTLFRRGGGKYFCGIIPEHVLLILTLIKPYLQYVPQHVLATRPISCNTPIEIIKPRDSIVMYTLFPYECRRAPPIEPMLVNLV
jgi:hypothetical protein